VLFHAVEQLRDHAHDKF